MAPNNAPTNPQTNVPNRDVHEWFGPADYQTKCAFLFVVSKRVSATNARSFLSVLEPLRQLDADRSKWTLKALDLPQPTDNAMISRVARDPKLLYSCTNTDVQDQLNEALNDYRDSCQQETAAKMVHLAAKSYHNYKTEREEPKSLRKAAAGFQSFLHTIGKFLEAFKGVADIVKAANQTFGGLAYGTVSLLVSVAIFKQQREETIQDMIEELEYALPRLDTLRKLKPKESMRKLIVEVFRLIIILCRDTIEYFASGNTLKRLLKALSPAQLKVKHVSEIRSKLSEIRKESEVVMLEEIFRMRHQLQEIQETGTDTNVRVRDTQAVMKGTDMAYMSDLRVLLGLKQTQKGIFPNTDIDQYEKTIAAEFEVHTKRFQAARRMSWNLLNSEHKFSTWYDQAASSLLLLGGWNWLDDGRTDLNWLSDASTLVIRELAKRKVQQPSMPICTLSYFCMTGHVVHSERHRRDFLDICKQVAYQIAERHPDLLTYMRDAVCSAIESTKWKAADTLVAYEAMVQLLIDLLAEFDDDVEVFLVIDRLDTCRWSSDLPGTSNRMHDAVQALLSLVRSRQLAHIRVKVLLVVDGAAAKSVSQQLSRERGETFSWQIDWVQESDDN